MSVIVTAACPARLINDANHLAMALGRSEHDALTYGVPSWQDDAGNLYACACALVPDEWVSMAQSELTRPVWDLDGKVDMLAAKRTQSRIIIGSSANPDGLAVILGMSGVLAIETLGLTQVEES